jgi:hypothetical protein
LALRIAAILLQTFATHALGHLIGVAATPPHVSKQFQGPTIGPFLLDVVAVKLVVGVLIDVDVFVLRVETGTATELIGPDLLIGPLGYFNRPLDLWIGP